MSMYEFDQAMNEPQGASSTVDTTESGPAVVVSGARSSISGNANDGVTGNGGNSQSTSARFHRLPRLLRKFSLPVSAVLGVLIAFLIVLAWFPNSAGAWHLPLQQIDAPAHYHFIRKILDFGPSAALHLWDNGAYYPPLFHLVAAGLIVLGRVFGIHVSIYAAFNIVWLFTSGIVWPAGMSLLATYWIRRVDGSDGVGDIDSDGNSVSTAKHEPAFRPFSCCMAVLVPVLAVSSASHPFTMLSSGPLISYGLATTLLPFWLYVTLRCFDAIASRRHRLKWVLLTIALGALCIFAHPRIAFTWLLLMVPFILLRLPWKLIASAVAVVALAAVAFFFYMTGHYRSSRYLDPSSWFHTYQPNHSVREALRVLFSDNIAGFAGGFMAIVVVCALLIALMVAVAPKLLSRCSVHTARPYPNLRKDAICIIADFALVGLVYVCSTSLTGWFPNIVAAAWYRAETRPLTMLPFAVIPLLVFAACALSGLHADIDMQESGQRATQPVVDNVDHREATDGNANHADTAHRTVTTPSRPGKTAMAQGDSAPRITGGTGASADASVGASSGTSVKSRVAIWPELISVLVLAALALSCQVANTTRSDLSASVAYNMQLNGKPADEQLTAAKYQVLRQVASIAGPDALVISDPMNGSMYGATIFDTNMLYTVYNTMHEQNGAIFGKVEDSFASGDGGSLLDTACPITSGPTGERSNTYPGDRHSKGPVYFLAMGPQAPSLKMFTFRQQYDSFHSQKLIDSYVRQGAMSKVKDFSGVDPSAKDWALYRLGCGR